MNKIAKIACAAATSLALLGAPSAMADDHAPTKGEQKLAKMLEGRVAGEPERCLQTVATRSFTIIDETAIVYRQGRTLWVNTTRNPEDIDDNDIMVIDRFSANRLCRTDQVTLNDRYSGFFSGVLFLDDFVPYRKTDG